MKDRRRLTEIRQLIRLILLESDLGDFKVGWGDSLLDFLPDSLTFLQLNTKIRDAASKKSYFSFIDSGGFRTVYGIFDNPLVVLKVAKNEHGVYTNQREIALGKDPIFSGIFPRVFAASPGGKWFIQEKIDTGDDEETWAQEIADYFLPGRLPLEDRENLKDSDITELFLAMLYDVLPNDLLFTSLDDDEMERIKIIHGLLVKEGQGEWKRWAAALNNQFTVGKKGNEKKFRFDINVLDLRYKNVGFSRMREKSGIRAPLIHDSSIID